MQILYCLVQMDARTHLHCLGKSFSSSPARPSVRKEPTLDCMPCIPLSAQKERPKAANWPPLGLICCRCCMVMQTTHHGLQPYPYFINQGALEKRGKETYGPPLGKRLLLWLDDMSMPQRDAYGTQQPLALLRQLLDRKARPLDICFIALPPCVLSRA